MLNFGVCLLLARFPLIEVTIAQNPIGDGIVIRTLRESGFDILTISEKLLGTERARRKTRGMTASGAILP